MTYFSVSDFYKERFGEKIYKISVDGNCTCPNRDGTKDTRGCIFCSESGSGDFTAKQVFSKKDFFNKDVSNDDFSQKDFLQKELSIEEQIELGKSLVLSKMPKKNCTPHFIAYFQNFTNTYGNFERLTSQFLKALSQENIVGIAIATRVDCLNDKMLIFLSDLSEKTFVQLEFGLQTSNEESAKYIRRHFLNSEYEQTMKRVKEKAPKIHIVTHIIFGLPNETKEDMMNTVRFAIKNKTDGVKIACLHILKNTDLALDYQNQKFKALEMDEYFSLVKSALEIIPKDVVIHRLTGDGSKSLLIAPLWTANKKKVLNELKKL